MNSDLMSRQVRSTGDNLHLGLAPELGEDGVGPSP